MSLISITADFSTVCHLLRQIVTLLTRLADAAERLAPVLPPDDAQAPVYQAGPADIHLIDDEAGEQVRAGMQIVAERYGVVPGSPAFDVALRDYEQEMKRVYGDDTVLDWEEIFKQAGEGSQQAG